MIKLIGKTLKIVETEIYNNKILAFIANICMLILMLCLQFGDLTLKVTGNYIVLLWIAMNVCFTFNIFLKSNRQFILCIGELENSNRYLFLLLVAMSVNFHWLIVIFFQLVTCFGASIGNALLITFIQYIYAVALGAFGGVIQINGLGVLLIGLFGIYNFIFCNPYNYEASSHMFIISELIFTTNDINTESIINFSIFALFFGTIAFLSMRMSVRRKISHLLLCVSSFVLAYAVLLLYTVYDYQRLNAEEYILYEQQNQIEYKGLPEDDIRAVSDILFLFEDEWNKIEDNMRRDTHYTIQKKFLPEIVWLIKGGFISPIQISNGNVEVNILSRNMLYFENPELLKAFLEEICTEMETNVSGYNSSKYTRHIINGYSMCILKNVSENLPIESADDVYEYYESYYDEMLVLPTTEYNFVKKLAYVVYCKYPEYINELYISVMENKIDNDKEFLNLFKYDFEEIYGDVEIANIISYVE